MKTVTKDGVSLRGLVKRPRLKGTHWVLFFPGNDFRQLTQGQEFLERLADGRDWGLSVTAYRGYDSTGGKPSPATLASDANEVYQTLLSSERLNPTQVNIVAFSLGGYGATQLLNRVRRPNERWPTLSLLASVENIEMFNQSWLERFLPGDVYDARPQLSLISGPVLVVYGDQDTVLGIGQGRAINARLGTNSHYFEVAGAGHNDLLNNNAALSAVRQWIESSAAH